MTIRLITLIIMGLSCIACSQRPDAPVPRPQAYPRIADPGQSYSAIDGIPVRFETNTSAVVSMPKSHWIDISYPSLNATLHISLTPADTSEIDNIIANRIQRIRLNLADRSTVENTEINSPQFRSVIFRSPDSRSTPLQFIATDDSAWVVSGVAFFDRIAPDAPVDSLSPAISYINRDLTRALSNLSAK